MKKWLSKKIVLILMGAALGFGALYCTLVIVNTVLVSAISVLTANEMNKDNTSCSTVSSGGSGATSLVDKDFNSTQFQAYMLKNGGALGPHAQDIIDVSNEAGVSVYLTAAIMMVESGRGTSSACRIDNNPSGMSINEVPIHYGSMKEGMAASKKTLHNLVVERGLNTLDKLGPVYCPPNTANWIKMVASFMAEMKNTKNFSQGETIGQIGGGCNPNDISVSGEKMSYFDKVFPLAKKQLGKPYVLGANINSDNPSSFDCGAFTLWILQQSGVKVPFNRIAQDQFNKTKRVDAKDVKAGDLIFFEHTYDTGRGESITHVGMVISKTEFIAAQGDNVQIAKMDNSYWKAHFGGFGRIQ